MGAWQQTGSAADGDWWEDEHCNEVSGPASLTRVTRGRVWRQGNNDILTGRCTDRCLIPCALCRSTSMVMQQPLKRPGATYGVCCLAQTVCSMQSAATHTPSRAPAVRNPSSLDTTCVLHLSFIWLDSLPQPLRLSLLVHRAQVSQSCLHNFCCCLRLCYAHGMPSFCLLEPFLLLCQVYGLPFNLTRKYQAAVGKPVRCWVHKHLLAPLHIHIIAPVTKACKSCCPAKGSKDAKNGSVAGGDWDTCP